MPALLESPTIEPLVGELPNVPIEEGVRATIEHFRNALQAGVLAAAGAQIERRDYYQEGVDSVQLLWATFTTSRS